MIVPRRKYFPDPNHTLEDGLLDIFDEINTEILLEAYSHGIFPWPQEGLPILWFSPVERGILDFKNLKIPKSFQKFLKKTNFEIKYNTAFEKVIRACAKKPRPNQSGTWITTKIIKAYLQFHRDGYAHSIEAWQNGHLIGGLYGVYVGGVFAGESMFYDVAEASKICLYHLIEKLKTQGQTWMDTQTLSPMLRAWGGTLISRQEFLQRLHKAQAEERVIKI